MNTLQAFQATMATRLHMTGAYDIQKYGIARNRFNQQMLDKRSDKWVFQKLADKWLYQKRLMYYVAAVYVVMPNLWVGELVNISEYKPHYYRLKRFISAPVDVTVADTEKMMDKNGSLEVSLKIEDGELPTIINDAISGIIHPESVVMYDRMCGLFNQINTHVGWENPIWKSIGHRLTKYQPFVTISSDDVVKRCRKTIYNKINDI